jgi:fructoselysine-6-P-deglycase FrlB-like protein
MNLTYTEMLDTFNALKKTQDYLENTWNGIETFFKDKKRFVFIGCGSSYSLAKSMSIIVSMHTGFPSSAMAAGDILLHSHRYAKCFDGALVVCISRSGRTSELLMALDALKSQGYSFTVASHICADDTPLAAKSDFSLSTPWAFDNSVCQTRSVTNFYFAAAYISAKITGNQAVLDDLEHIINKGPEYTKTTEALADKLSEQPWTHCVVLADAELEGLAEEGALAFKEICQLPSNYYHLLDLRHGPMVLLGEKTLVIAALGPKNDHEFKLIDDIKEKKSELVVFSDTSTEPKGVHHLSYGRQLSHIALGIPFIVLCQMIAYKKSLKTGADPDKPTGLKAWIAL